MVSVVFFFHFWFLIEMDKSKNKNEYKKEIMTKWNVRLPNTSCAFRTYRLNRADPWMSHWIRCVFSYNRLDILPRCLLSRAMKLEWEVEIDEWNRLSRRWCTQFRWHQMGYNWSAAVTYVERVYYWNENDGCSHDPKAPRANLRFLAQDDIPYWSILVDYATKSLGCIRPFPISRPPNIRNKYETIKQTDQLRYFCHANKTFK